MPCFKPRAKADISAVRTANSKLEFESPGSWEAHSLSSAGRACSNSRGKSKAVAWRFLQSRTICGESSSRALPQNKEFAQNRCITSINPRLPYIMKLLLILQYSFAAFLFEF